MNASIGTVYLLKRAELALRACAEVALLPFGLTPTQFLVLFRLEYDKGLSSAELARAAGVRPQSIVDHIRPLERRKLIVRREDPEHRSILRIQLSAAGRALFRRALPVVSQLERELLSDLTSKELTYLRAALEKLLKTAEAHDAHPHVRRPAGLKAR